MYTSIRSTRSDTLVTISRLVSPPRHLLRTAVSRRRICCVSLASTSRTRLLWWFVQEKESRGSSSIPTSFLQFPVTPAFDFFELEMSKKRGDMFFFLQKSKEMKAFFDAIFASNTLSILWRGRNNKKFDGALCEPTPEIRDLIIGALPDVPPEFPCPAYGYKLSVLMTCIFGICCLQRKRWEVLSEQGLLLLPDVQSLPEGKSKSGKEGRKKEKCSRMSSFQERAFVDIIVPSLAMGLDGVHVGEFIPENTSNHQADPCDITLPVVDSDLLVTNDERFDTYASALETQNSSIEPSLPDRRITDEQRSHKEGVAFLQNYRTVEIEMDGSCFFRSVVYLLYMHEKEVHEEDVQEQLANELRNQVCDQHLLNREEMQSFCNLDHRSFEQYVDLLRSPLTWAGTTEAKSASDVIQRPITLVRGDFVKGFEVIRGSEVGEEHDQTKRLYIWYLESQNHFQPLIPTSLPEPPQRCKERTGQAWARKKGIQTPIIIDDASTEAAENDYVEVAQRFTHESTEAAENDHAEDYFPSEYTNERLVSSPQPSVDEPYVGQIAKGNKFNVIVAEFRRLIKSCFDKEQMEVSLNNLAEGKGRRDAAIYFCDTLALATYRYVKVRKEDEEILISKIKTFPENFETLDLDLESKNKQDRSG